MKPSSLLGLALELVETLASSGPLPADARVGQFFRDRRFLGSHDRRFLGSVAYAWLRHAPRARARWRAWAEASGLSPEHPAGSVAAGSIPGWELLPDLIALGRDGLLPWGLAPLIEAAREIASRPIDERSACAAGAEAGRTTAPAWAALARAVLESPESAERLLAAETRPEDPVERLVTDTSLPAWLALRLREERGEDDARRIARALAEPAEVDLRVSLRATTREEVRALLWRELGADLRPTPFSPLGLRMEGRRDLAGTVPARRGWIEVEDEGSQIIAIAVAAAVLRSCGGEVRGDPPIPSEGRDPSGIEMRTGLTVIDACAGAGGKTLALADILGAGEAAAREGTLSLGPFPRSPELRIYAADVAPRRLDALRERARRARLLEAIRIVPVAPEGPLPASLPEADLVLVDAPCSGLGTLRRNPDLKLRHGPDDIERFARLQAAILRRWAPKVRPGGTLAYATCSILAAENEAVVDAFSSGHPEFIPTRSTWAERHLPAACLRGATIRLDPVLTGTDGFFVALWSRGAGPPRVR